MRAEGDAVCSERYQWRNSNAGSYAAPGLTDGYTTAGFANDAAIAVSVAKTITITISVAKTIPVTITITIANGKKLINIDPYEMQKCRDGACPRLYISPL